MVVRKASAGPASVAAPTETGGALGTAGVPLNTCASSHSPNWESSSAGVTSPACGLTIHRLPASMRCQVGGVSVC